MATKKKTSQKRPRKRKPKSPAPDQPGNPFDPGGEKDPPVDPDNPPWRPAKGTYEAPTGSLLPVELLSRLENATRTMHDPIAISSAKSLERSNEPYNREVQARYEKAYSDWFHVGKPGQEPPNPRTYGLYKVADIRTLNALKQAGIEVPAVPWISYNQHSYPPPQSGPNWYALVEPFLKEKGY